jgi:dTDP-4-amino-4,6-dideoxygalactose transaminase
MGVPLLDLKLQQQAIESELLEAVRRVFKNGQYVLGPETEKLEQDVAKLSGVQFALGVSSGTDALLLALMGLDIGLGCEVITTPFSFFATAGSIARLGAKPVFCDIDPATYNLSASLLDSVIGSKTRAVMPVHLYGQVADMPSILKIADKHRIKIVEDAAQAIGATDASGRAAGSFGAAACLSFYPTKNLGALGDAGMVMTSDPALADKMRLLRVHGSQARYYHKMIGGNFRMDALQAAFLNVKLAHLSQWTSQRRAKAKRYDSLFEQSGLTKEGIVTPKSSPGHIYHQYVIRAPKRDSLRDFMSKRQIGTEVFYPLPLHLQECFAYLGYKKGSFPEAEKAALETVALPIYPELTDTQQEEVVLAVKAFYKGF